MTTELKRLREERAHKLQTARSIYEGAKAEGRVITAGEERTFDTLTKEAEKLEREILELEQRTEKEQALTVDRRSRAATPIQFHRHLKDVLKGQKARLDFNPFTRRSLTTGNTTAPLFSQTSPMALYQTAKQTDWLDTIPVIETRNNVKQPYVARSEWAYDAVASGGITMTGVDEASSVTPSTFQVSSHTVDLKSLKALVQFSEELEMDSEVDISEMVMETARLAVREQMARRILYSAAGDTQGFAGFDTVSGSQEVNASGFISAAGDLMPAIAGGIRKLYDKGYSDDDMILLMTPYAWESLNTEYSSNDSHFVEAPQFFRTMQERGQVFVTNLVDIDNMFLFSPSAMRHYYGGQIELTLNERYRDQGLKALYTVTRHDLRYIDEAGVVKIINVNQA